VTAQSTAHAVNENHGRPIHRDTVRNRLCERGIHCRRPARCYTKVTFKILIDM